LVRITGEPLPPLFIKVEKLAVGGTVVEEYP
jgi:hypothetical protein